MFECTWARAFWQDLKDATAVKIPVLHPLTWPTDLVEGKLISEDDACLILCGAWAVWTERNAIWHGEGGRSVMQSVRWATETTVDVRQAGKTMPAQTGRCTTHWKPPYQGTIKFNIDAGYNLDSNEGTTGCVVRDHTGSITMSNNGADDDVGAADQGGHAYEVTVRYLAYFSLGLV